MSAVGIVAPKRPSCLLEKGFYITAPPSGCLFLERGLAHSHQKAILASYSTPPTRSLSQTDSGSNRTFGLSLLLNQIPPSGRSFPAEQGKVPPTGYCRGSQRMQTKHKCDPCWQNESECAWANIELHAKK